VSEATQADRDAAKALWEAIKRQGPIIDKKEGMVIGVAFLDAFAAHREAETERCAKIVTDTLVGHEPLVPDEAYRVRLVCDSILTAMKDSH
jgi:hypothetical protein